MARDDKYLDPLQGSSTGRRRAWRTTAVAPKTSNRRRSRCRGSAAVDAAAGTWLNQRRHEPYGTHVNAFDARCYNELFGVERAESVDIVNTSEAPLKRFYPVLSGSIRLEGNIVPPPSWLLLR